MGRNKWVIVSLEFHINYGNPVFVYHDKPKNSLNTCICPKLASACSKFSWKDSISKPKPLLGHLWLDVIFESDHFLYENKISCLYTHAHFAYPLKTNDVMLYLCGNISFIKEIKFHSKGLSTFHLWADRQANGLFTHSRSNVINWPVLCPQFAQNVY